MKIHYYSGWFDENMPQNYLQSLRNDITDTKSLVLIWGCWGGDELIDFVQNTWLKPGNITFDNCHLVDNRKTKEEGHKLIKEASVLFILGGDTQPQADFFAQYELAAPIKQTNANIIAGFSAGAINMAAKGLSAKPPKDGEKTTTHNGLGMDNFCYAPYFSPSNDDVTKTALLPLSKEINIYATCPQSFIQTTNNQVTAFGDGVYLFANSTTTKL